MYLLWLRGLQTTSDAQCPHLRARGLQTTSVPGHRCPPGATKQLELQNDWYQRGSGGWPDHTSGASMGPVVLGSATRDPDGWNDSLNTP